MKKIFSKPSAEIIVVETQNIIASSDSTHVPGMSGGGNTGITPGGSTSEGGVSSADGRTSKGNNISAIELN